MKTDLTKRIEQWGEDKGIIQAGNIEKQASKNLEEAVEVFEAIYTKDYENALLEIGDNHVTNTLLAKMLGSSIEQCGEMALAKISKRKGKLVEGVFYKEGDL